MGAGASIPIPEGNVVTLEEAKAHVGEHWHPSFDAVFEKHAGWDGRIPRTSFVALLRKIQAEEAQVEGQAEEQEPAPAQEQDQAQGQAQEPHQEEAQREEAQQQEEPQQRREPQGQGELPETASDAASSDAGAAAASPPGGDAAAAPGEAKGADVLPPEICCKLGDVTLEIEVAMNAGLTPLIVDLEEEALTFWKNCDTFVVLDAKTMGERVALQATPVAQAMDHARHDLYHSMKKGYTFVIACRDGVPDFRGTLNDESAVQAGGLALGEDEACFPLEVFECGTLRTLTWAKRLHRNATSRKPKVHDKYACIVQTSLKASEVRA